MFYLTGGTALSEFYLAHRRSYDIDLFTTEKDFVIQFSHTFEEAMKKFFQVKTIRRLLNFAEFEVSDGIAQTRFQIALDSPFRFGEPVDSDTGIKVNDYTDLIVDKLLAFFGRVEPRDAVDLFFILKNEDLYTGWLLL
jgi:predicted nucleotidyltransferase component of viral defense system